jgi:exodeoxyribonuclease X
MTLVRCIDFETTGLRPPEAAVCEYGWTDLRMLENGRWAIENSASVFVNPGRSIPPAASAVHGITDADVCDALPWPQVRLWIWNDEPEAVVAHNARFEAKFLTPSQADDTTWIDTYAVTLRVVPQAPEHKLQTLRYFLKLDCDLALAEPRHRAGPDSYVNAVLMLRMLAKYSVEQLVEISRQPVILSKMPFGKHAGRRFAEVPADYLVWMAWQSDMDEDAVRTAKHELSRRRGNGSPQEGLAHG